MNDTPPLTGMDLKVRRIVARVLAKHVAAAMGINSSRLSRIEGQSKVTDRMAARYLAALDSCRTSGTSNAA